MYSQASEKRWLDVQIEIDCEYVSSLADVKRGIKKI